MVGQEGNYEGDPLDGTYQHITERPAADKQDTSDDDDDGETVYVTAAEPEGEQTVENVPIPGDIERPDTEGQTSWEDWEVGL